MKLYLWPLSFCWILITVVEKKSVYIIVLVTLFLVIHIFSLMLVVAVARCCRPWRGGTCWPGKTGTGSWRCWRCTHKSKCSTANFSVWCSNSGFGSSHTPLLYCTSVLYWWCSGIKLCSVVYQDKILFVS